VANFKSITVQKTRVKALRQVLRMIAGETKSKKVKDDAMMLLEGLDNFTGDWKQISVSRSQEKLLGSIYDNVDLDEVTGNQLPLL